ncbi:MAG TPA: lasso peptide biosynthesis B2 protein [Pseudolabrys sp.]|nr:lasso peptide biosynthesis B2 protein [Pseudolabrys sp.]
MKLKTIRRTYLREAAVMMILARLAVRVIPPARIFSWANRPPRRINRFAGDEANWVAWAVEKAAAKPWINALCLPRALAAHAMLRRRGIASRLCLGIARKESGLAAHAWVEVDKQKIDAGGGEVAYTRLAEFGGAHL